MERTPLLPDSPRVRRWRDWTGPYAWLLAIVVTVVVACSIRFGIVDGLRCGVLPVIVLGGLTPSMERRRTKWSAAEERAGLEEIERGDHAAAAARFTRMRERYVRAPVRWRVATFNLANAELARGELARATEFFEEIERPRSKGRLLPRILPVTAARLALVHGLAGSLEPARAWLAEAQRRELAREEQLLAQVVIELRGGSSLRARDALAEAWSHIERTHSTSAANELRLFHAFALARCGAPSSEVEAQLRHVRGERASAFTAYVAAWPELREFVERMTLVPR